MAENSGRKRSVRGVPSPEKVRQAAAQAAAPPENNSGWGKLLGNKPLSAGVGVAVALVTAGIVWILATSGKRDDRSPDEDVAGVAAAESRPTNRKRREANAPAEPPQFKTIACKVYTPEPAFFVLVDGELARDRIGKKLTTPCEIGLTRGPHSLTIVKEKFRDLVEQVTVDREQTFELAPTYEPFGEPSAFLTSRFGLARSGAPIELAQVNASGPAWDPILSADGLTLWYAGQKSDGKGIYFSRREHVYDDFGAPELAGRNSDRAASPSVTADGLVVAYAVPSKAHIRSLVRAEAGAPFRQGLSLRQSENDDDRWLSARIAPDGKSLMFAAASGGKTSILVTRRKSLRKPFDGEARAVRMPGGHPRLTDDGLRQFWFDGERLFRASRADPDSAFSEPETLVDLSIDGYTSRNEYRQCCVSEDEQWLFYSDDPQGAGKLYAVRIADGPRWGYAPRGKPLAVRESAQATPADEPEMPSEPVAGRDEPPAKADPRAAPLPYAQLRDKLASLIAAADYPSARELITAAQSDPALAVSKTQLAWDLADVDRLILFRQRLEESIEQLKPGDLIKAGSIQIEFETYAEGFLTGKTKGNGKPVSRALGEFAPLDLVSLVDKRIQRDDGPAQLEIATFLAQSPKVSQQQLQLRFDRAGAEGKDLAERPLLRRVHLIEQEIARDNLALALRQIEELNSLSPKSRSAGLARELRDGIYTRIAWRKIGRQIWESPVAGEFTTTGGKSPDTYLASPGEYGNFLLTLEWKTAGDTAQGGVYFRYKNAGSLRKNAFKIHLAGDHAQRNTPDKFSTGSLFGITAPRSNPVLPNGQWNTLTLRVEGERVRATINGTEALDTRASSKDVGPRGLVCLDGEFTGITYRKMLVYELPVEK